MKKIVALIILAAFAISCSSDSSSSHSYSGVLVKRTIQDFTNGSPSVTTFYQYNGAKLVSTTSDDMICKYYYTGNLITQEEIYFNDDLAYVLNFSYDNQNRLVQSRRETIGPGQIFRNVYHYNADNTISVDEYFIFETGSDEELSHAKFYMNSAGEIDKIEEYNGSSVQTTTFSYDQQNNPFKNILGMRQLLVPESGFDSNVTSIVYTGYPPETLNRSFQFTYNTDQYPVSMSRTIGTNQDATMQYFYE